MPIPRRRTASTKAQATTDPTTNSDADEGGDAAVSAESTDNLDNELEDESDESASAAESSDQQGDEPLEAPVPAYIPLKERTALPEILYVKTTYPHGAVIDGVHMPLRSGFKSNDRYLSRLLLNQDVELVEDFRECDAYQWA